MAVRIVLCLLLAFSKVAFSQSDSLLFTAINEPRPAKNPADAIFNGREHILYHPQISGTAYFDSGGWQKGPILYQNILYKDVPMKYDLVADELVVFHVNGYSRVVLFTPWIQTFTLGNSKFVYLEAGEAPLSRAGLYQELVKGSTGLYAKRLKLISETASTFAVERKFENRYSYFVLMNGKYHKVNSRKDAMALLKDKKNQVRSKLKAAGIRRFKPNLDLALTKTIEYYNELSR